jgi:hypothetical protein
MPREPAALRASTSPARERWTVGDRRWPGKALHEIALPRRRHRRRHRRRQRALPSGEIRLDRRRLVERAELTCGSTWHAAGGFHALNDDPNIAALQGYTIRLYDEIQRESGVSVGMHMTGGISLAASKERMEMLKAERSMYETMEIDTRL